MLKRSRTTWRVSVGALVLGAVVLFGAGVSAQEDDAYQEMLRLSAEAQEHYDAGQIADAADTYRQAYTAYPQPILLKNEMIARYLLEECERSVELAEQFVASGEAMSDDELDIEAVYADCSLLLAESALEVGELEEARAYLKLGEAHWDVELAAEGEQLWERIGVAQADLEEGREDASLAIAPAPEVGSAPVGGWALTAGGVAGIVGASVWYVSSRGQFEELQEVASDGTDRARYEELSASVSRARWGVPTLYALGGAATIGGILWIVMSSSDEEPALSVMPEVGADGAGARLRLRF